MHKRGDKRHHASKGDGGKPARVLGYIRVSTVEQARSGTSTERQREEIEAFCRREGYPAPLIREEHEGGGAEKIERRVEMRALLRDARAGDLVVVTKQDRWSRDTLFFLESTRDLVARGVRFFSLAERFDPATPEGRFAATIMAAVAEQERARILDRTTGALRRLRSLGMWPAGKPPFGYKVERPSRRLVPVPERADLVREANRRCIAGESVREIAAWLRRAWPALGWDLLATRKLLGSRFYLGELSDHTGRWFPAHEPILTRAAWERAREALESRRLSGRVAKGEIARTASWLLRGLMRCKYCGKKIGARYGAAATYYACNTRLRDRDGCESRSHRQEELDASVGLRVVARLVELRGEIARVGATLTAPTTEGARVTLTARRSRLVDLYERGRIDGAEFDRRAAAIDIEIGRLAVEDARSVPVRPEVRAELLVKVETIALVWARATGAERREFVRLLARRITLSNDGAAVEWKTVEELAE